MYNFFFQIISDTKKELQQEVRERQDTDKELNLKIDSEIQKLSTTIESMASTIESLKSADNVLTNSLNDNALRFHVETKQESGHWPENTLISYKTKLTDTHNAMNTGTGKFTAPFSGTYGFVFYADFWRHTINRFLKVDHNGAISNIFEGSIHDSTHDYISSSIYFALNLKQGDTVGIFSGNTDVSMYVHPAKFTGFLLQKN
jgi:hypothetical protein